MEKSRFLVENFFHNKFKKSCEQSATVLKSKPKFVLTLRNDPIFCRRLEQQINTIIVVLTQVIYLSCLPEVLKKKKNQYEA